jgi:hypothetical protein
MWQVGKAVREMKLIKKEPGDFLLAWLFRYWQIFKEI